MPDKLFNPNYAEIAIADFRRRMMASDLHPTWMDEHELQVKDALVKRGQELYSVLGHITMHMLEGYKDFHLNGDPILVLRFRIHAANFPRLNTPEEIVYVKVDKV